VKITSLSSLPLQFSFRPNFVKNTAKGLNGGGNGGSAKILINGKEQKTDPVVIKKNEYVEVITAGGGGLGNYKNRDSMKKKEDKTNKIYL
jgi:N-methylhydantoinase B/oxoprolinase/acetone carboxylase alpha subunit